MVFNRILERMVPETLVGCCGNEFTHRTRFGLVAIIMLVIFILSTVMVKNQVVQGMFLIKTNCHNFVVVMRYENMSQNNQIGNQNKNICRNFFAHIAKI